MNQQPAHRDSQSRGSFVVPLTCSPPRSPANTAPKNLVDRIQPTGSAQWIYFAVIGALVIIAPLLAVRPGLAVGAVAAFAGSAWCLANFWRCREAHCVVTAGGWAALFALELVELGIGRSVIHGSESGAFFAILIIGLVFECAWQVRFGTNAMIRHASATRSE